MISPVSAIHHGHTMQKMAEANAGACYCSVFDECWVSDLATVSPQPIEHCAVSPDTFTYLKPRKEAP